MAGQQRPQAQAGAGPRHGCHGARAALGRGQRSLGNAVLVFIFRRDGRLGIFGRVALLGGVAGDTTGVEFLGHGRQGRVVCTAFVGLLRNAPACRLTQRQVRSLNNDARNPVPPPVIERLRPGPVHSQITVDGKLAPGCSADFFIDPRLEAVPVHQRNDGNDRQHHSQPDAQSDQQPAQPAAARGRCRCGAGGINWRGGSFNHEHESLWLHASAGQAAGCVIQGR